MGEVIAGYILWFLISVGFFKIDIVILRRYNSKIILLSDVWKYIHYAIFWLRCIFYAASSVFGYSLLLEFSEGDIYLAYKATIIIFYLTLVILDAIVISSNFKLRYTILAFLVSLTAIIGLLANKENLAAYIKKQGITDELNYCENRGISDCFRAVKYLSTVDAYPGAPSDFLSLLDSEAQDESAKIYASFFPPVKEIKALLHLPHGAYTPDDYGNESSLLFKTYTFFVVGKDGKGNELFINKETDRESPKTTTLSFSRELVIGETVFIEFYEDNGDGILNPKTDRQLKNGIGEPAIQKIMVLETSPLSDNIKFSTLVPADLQVMNGLMFNKVILSEPSTIVIFKKRYESESYEIVGRSNPLPINREIKNVFIHTSSPLFSGNELKFMIVSEEGARQGYPNAHTKYIEDYFNKNKVKKTLRPGEQETIPKIISLNVDGANYLDYIVPKNPYLIR